MSTPGPSKQHHQQHLWHSEKQTDNVTLVLGMMSDSVGNLKYVELPARLSVQRRAGMATVAVVNDLVWKVASSGKWVLLKDVFVHR